MSIGKQINAFLEISEAFLRQSGAPAQFFAMPCAQQALKAIVADGNEAVGSDGGRAYAHNDIRIANDVLTGSGAAISNDERRPMIGRFT
ncbi:hypothetical protein LMG28727_02090 [Paraburkholderia kirstenboschensis]|uniref:hypothetical protein n=1 Tax=Paraburkholderia kirstenboschensis TaxID=1245436 RepID=UPI001918D57D|nr:hypothetical protein [Paraburkholderia kirstenboschensis]CAD6525813.1 hypothetical protein LMG28727_02090 [Paraburkholderia kirstenboschensis]